MDIADGDVGFFLGGFDVCHNRVEVVEHVDGVFLSCGQLESIEAVREVGHRYRDAVAFDERDPVGVCGIIVQTHERDFGMVLLPVVHRVEDAVDALVQRVVRRRCHDVEAGVVNCIAHLDRRSENRIAAHTRFIGDERRFLRDAEQIIGSKPRKHGLENMVEIVGSVVAA